jgi:hypothetical protein
MSAQTDFVEQIAQRVVEKFEKIGVSPGPVAQRLFTVGQAAVYIGRTKAATQHLIESGRIPTVRADARLFLDVRDLDAWIERNKHYPI